MKRFALIVISVAAVVFGTNLVAQAYPPGTASASVIAGSPGEVGGTFTVQVTNCLAGETVNVDLPANGDGPTSALCAATSGAGFFLAAPGSGSATVVLDHASTPGTNTGTAELVTSGVTLTFTVETTPAAGAPSPTIPATGSDATTSMLGYGAAALAIGIALTLIAANRRRSAVSAA